jgi:L-amino acid N-acyltransferase YncA
MDLLIREAQVYDAEGIINVLNPIIEAGIYSSLAVPFSIEAEREFILNFPKQGILHVAICRDEQKIVGLQNVEAFSNYTPAFNHVGVIGTFVALALRRQGIAKSLFKATFETAIDKGYEKLFAYVRADNVAALATYLSQGFSIIGTARKHAKINGKYVDEIMIEKFL